jgi:hypothetical protein
MTDIDTVLNTETLTISDPDAFYNDLIDLHAGLTEAQSAVVNWRLILLLANQAGGETARAAVKAAALRRA